MAVGVITGVGVGDRSPRRATADPLAALPLVERFEASDLALADSAAVASWPGRLGAYTASQGTPGARPTYRSLLYGEPAVLFGAGNTAWKYLAVAGLTAHPAEWAVRVRFPNTTGSAYYGTPLAGDSSEPNPGLFLDTTGSNQSRYSSYGRAWFSRGAEQGTDLDARLYQGNGGAGWCGTAGGTDGLDQWFCLRSRPAHSGELLAALLLNGMYGTDLILSRVLVFSRQLTAGEAALVDATLGA